MSRGTAMAESASVTLAQRFKGLLQFRVVADTLTLVVAVVLPWSTSMTAILIPIWLVFLLPTLDRASVRRELMTSAGGLPVLIWCLAAVGMLWADVSWAERLHGLRSFHKLLVIPLLLIQFRRCEYGSWVLVGFLGSCTALLIASWFSFLMPGLSWRGETVGVPVKDYIAQSGVFVICVAALALVALEAWQVGRRQLAAASIALMLLFLANIGFVVTSRTALIVLIVLLGAFGWRFCGWRGTVALVLGAVIVGGTMWAFSPHLRWRVLNTVNEIWFYRTTNAETSAGLRLEFWKKSIEFVSRAPVIGHGTGSIASLFRQAAAGHTGAAGDAATNPHNQIFAVALQLGLVGVVVLLALWAAHLMLFAGLGLPAWIGLVIVLQNVVSSMFNSHLFDFNQGWLYAFGVGVTGGMVLSGRPLTLEKGVAGCGEAAKACSAGPVADKIH